MSDEVRGDLTPSEVGALGAALGRLLMSVARRWEAEGLTPADLAARLRALERAADDTRD